MIRQSRYGKRFLGCSKFPECRQTYPLPQKGDLTFSDKVCQHCGAPVLTVSAGKYSKEFCPKMDCEFNGKKKKPAKAVQEKEVKKPRKSKAKTSTSRGVKRKVAKKASP